MVNGYVLGGERCLVKDQKLKAAGVNLKLVSVGVASEWLKISSQVKGLKQ